MNYPLSEDLPIQTKKTIANLSKQTEDLQYILKLDQKQFNEEKEKFQNEFNRLQTQIDFMNNSLESTLNELNQKERNIYEIQHDNLTKAISKLANVESIKTEIQNKIELKQNQIETTGINENNLYTLKYLLLEDISGTYKEINQYEQKIKLLNNKIEQIRQTYPQEKFKFLCDDLVAEQKMYSLHQEINKLINQQNSLLKENEIIKQKQSTLNDEFVIIQSKFDIINSNIEFNVKEDTTLQEIEMNIDNKLYNECAKFKDVSFIIEHYCSNKNFTIPNKINYNTLYTLIKDLENLYFTYKSILKEVNEEMDSAAIKLQKIKNSKQTKKNISNYNSIKNEFDILEYRLNIFKQLVCVIEKQGKIYYNILPNNKTDIVIDNNFEKNLFDFFTDLILVVTLDKEDEDNEISVKSNLMLYYNKINDKYSSLSSLLKNKTGLEEEIQKTKQQLHDYAEQLENNSLVILDLKKEISQQKSEYQINQDQVTARFKNIKNILSTLRDSDFEQYLRLNEKLYNNIIKSGLKVKNYEMAITKEAFIDFVIIDHSTKKRVINELIEEIAKYEVILSKYKTIVVEIKNIYNNEVKEKYDNARKEYTTLKTEQKMLKQSIKDFDKSIKDSLVNLEKETLKEKETLHTELNINFYKQQIIFLTENIEKLQQVKESLINEFNEKEKAYLDKEQKLSSEVKVLKTKLNCLISSTSSSIQSLGREDGDGGKKGGKDNLLFNAFDEYSPTIPPPLNTSGFEGYNLSKIKKLISPGVLLFKQNGKSRSFTLENKKKFPPEKCGYVLRNLILDPQKKCLSVFNNKLGRSEQNVNVNEISSIMISDNKTRQLIEKEKSKNEHSLQTKDNYIHFILILNEGNLDLIAQNYLSYQIFTDAIEALIKNKNILNNLISK